MVFEESAMCGAQSRTEVVPLSVTPVATSPVHFADAATEDRLRKKFLTCAAALRRISSNFISEKFKERQLQMGALDCGCMAGLLQGNESGIRRLTRTLEEAKAGGLSEKRATFYEAHLAREAEMLEIGRAMYDAWCGASQKAGTVPLPIVTPVTAPNPAIAALTSALTCFLCSMMPMLADLEDVVSA